MMIINNKVVWSDEELADLAFQQLQNQTQWKNDLDKYSFIKGFVCALNEQRG